MDYHAWSNQLPLDDPTKASKQKILLPTRQQEHLLLLQKTPIDDTPPLPFETSPP